MEKDLPFEARTQRLIDTLSIESHSRETEMMRIYIKEFIEVNVKEAIVIEDGENLYVTKGKVKKGEAYPCMACHTDTVHKISDEGIQIYENFGRLFAMDTKSLTMTGIGGDDKVGIHVALEMLLNNDVMKSVFFMDEEIGCVGSRKANMDFFDDVGYVFECDRKGFDDFVDRIGNKLLDDKFRDIISPIVKDKYKRNFVKGGMTDVDALAQKGLKVCSANMSCGYYRPHSAQEYVLIHQVHSTADMVQDMIHKLGCKQYINEDAGKSSYVATTYKNPNEGKTWNVKTRRFEEDPVKKQTKSSTTTNKDSGSGNLKTSTGTKLPLGTGRTPVSSNPQKDFSTGYMSSDGSWSMYSDVLSATYEKQAMHKTLVHFGVRKGLISSAGISCPLCEGHNTMYDNRSESPKNMIVRGFFCFDCDSYFFKSSEYFGERTCKLVLMNYLMFDKVKQTDAQDHAVRLLTPFGYQKAKDFKKIISNFYNQKAKKPKGEVIKLNDKIHS